MEDIWTLEAGILWHQHGGSGFSMTLSEVEEMTWAEAIWWSNHANATREKEAAALRRGGKR